MRNRNGGSGSTGGNDGEAEDRGDWIKVTRVLTYEGPADHVTRTLTAENRYVKGERVIEFMTIKEGFEFEAKDLDLFYGARIGAAFDRITREHNLRTFCPDIPTKTRVNTLLDDLARGFEEESNPSADADLSAE